MRHCILASRGLSKRFNSVIVEENFLDSTFLGDRKTTLRQYLKANPSLMEELPPESLKERYSG
jgi:hypothetical protein